ncbi:polyphenol laccase [Haloferula helveola]|uniref:Polyphenol laccase n=1 Tax=Haloferula helveola TaxID=490095 RepID=A0ABN6HCX2_9BACT|nr:polyphenol laccase [Haloferula helveola]
MTEALCFLDPLAELPGLRVDFISKVPGVDIDGERDEVLERLEPFHRAHVLETFGQDDWWRAAQVHGREVAVIEESFRGERRPTIPDVDGLVTDVPGEILGIYVADCGPIWLADRVSGAVGVLHSGKKGTELGILEEGLRVMAEHYGTEPGDVTVVLGPCIRPPHYDIDFAADIARQAAGVGVGQFHDCGRDTAVMPDDYYSYRMEKGRTGRMLALIMRVPEA